MGDGLEVIGIRTFVDRLRAQQRYIDLQTAILHNNAIDEIRRLAEAGEPVTLLKDFGDRNPCALIKRASTDSKQARMEERLRAITLATKALPAKFHLQPEDLDWYKSQDPNKIFGFAESQSDIATSVYTGTGNPESIASGLTEQSRANQFLEPRPTDDHTIGATLSRPLSSDEIAEVQGRIASSRLAGTQHPGNDADSLYDI
ncbi:hypothetical protein HD553DRAFT_9022 [Filobasidium floriforme]|uniref:uncharacterized protein n=1 Tax=Filobasidium floriforme TaxID=5210 RepID=UPI001E8E7A28|nr:uncharacterized protein HD553DRAFT_9022 [Filobasidium floriforme]KAH8090565.1 hypothetical protein HD553DRAFT_9022 [Filobasidium floriforme]